MDQKTLGTTNKKVSDLNPRKKNHDVEEEKNGKTLCFFKHFNTVVKVPYLRFAIRKAIGNQHGKKKKKKGLIWFDINLIMNFVRTKEIFSVDQRSQDSPVAKKIVHERNLS